MYGAYTQEQQRYEQLARLKQRPSPWPAAQAINMQAPTMIVRDHRTGNVISRTSVSPQMQLNMPLPMQNISPPQIRKQAPLAVPGTQSQITPAPVLLQQTKVPGPVLVVRPHASQTRPRPVASSPQGHQVAFTNSKMGVGPDSAAKSVQQSQTSIGSAMLPNMGESPAKRQRPIMEFSPDSDCQLFTGQFPLVKPAPMPVRSSSSQTRTSVVSVNTPVLHAPPKETNRGHFSLVTLPMTPICFPEKKGSVMNEASDDRATDNASDEFLFPALPRDEDINLEDTIFDCHYYFDKYAEVRKECGDDRLKLRHHWDHSGIERGLSCSPVLDLAYFITRIPKDYQTRQLNYRMAYNFFLKHVSDRLPSSEFYNPVSYVKRYPQLKRYTAKQLILHYISIGRFNKLNASP